MTVERPPPWPPPDAVRPAQAVAVESDDFYITMLCNFPVEDATSNEFHLFDRPVPSIQEFCSEFYDPNIVDLSESPANSPPDETIAANVPTSVGQRRVDLDKVEEMT